MSDENTAAQLEEINKTLEQIAGSLATIAYILECSQLGVRIEGSTAQPGTIEG